jgi:hypothetical protein
MAQDMAASVEPLSTAIEATPADPLSPLAGDWSPGSLPVRDLAMDQGLSPSHHG